MRACFLALADLKRFVQGKLQVLWPLAADSVDTVRSCSRADDGTFDAFECPDHTPSQARKILCPNRCVPPSGNNIALTRAGSMPNVSPAALTISASSPVVGFRSRD